MKCCHVTTQVCIHKNWFCTKTPLNENGVWWCLPYTSIIKTQVTWSLLRPMPSTRLFLTMVVKPYIVTFKSLMPFRLLFFNLVLQSTINVWATPTNLYNPPSWIASTITLFELENFNQNWFQIPHWKLALLIGLLITYFLQTLQHTIYLQCA